MTPNDALFHFSTKVFKRSDGRSSVAAAAYRSASKLTDHRIGQTFDYTKKHVVSSFILTPSNAPAWALDREALWNAVERSENRKNSVVARELEISIPRDIPQSEWSNFAQEIVQKYVDAGAVADVAIHCPLALDKEPQPHIHVMLSLRKLDHTTEHGFSKSKNNDLISMFESGGRLGGERKDALNNERERIANIMNSYLIKSGSEKRADHRSYRDRGIDKTAEPLLGEQRIRAAKTRKKGDRRTNEVFMLRKLKQHEATLIQQLEKIEESIMRNYPHLQNKEYSEKKQDYKVELFHERFPDVSIDQAKIHMIDNRTRNFRAQMRDGSWLELSNSGRALQTYGGPANSYADELAANIAEAGFVDDVIKLQEANTFSKRSYQHENTRKNVNKKPILKAPDNTFETSESTDTYIQQLADAWYNRGYTSVEPALDGVWLRLGSARVQDTGDELKIYGKINDSAIDALMQKSVDEWDKELEIFGDKEFKDKAWLAAQRAGVTVYDRDTKELYQPSPEVKKQYEDAVKKLEAQAEALDGIQKRKSLAELVHASACRDKNAVNELMQRDKNLSIFTRFYLDDDQLDALRQETPQDIEKQLDAFRELGRRADQHNSQHYPDNEIRGEDYKNLDIDEVKRKNDAHDESMSICPR
ncbi:MobA/MobL family protein [Pseudochrobactrum sp. XF203]|uniref:MobA/MobL family protein n=1 Tax=Pseudochrobactrum sp. XF203 TaxID=2879116 RepID=UPI001CE2E514|nr:MobA/MobL family protein [Pseudochrobactrum sp. XF203]UCA44759.1 MobA/MobL family protein [Pseudochrobactrum sp. XF203]